MALPLGAELLNLSVDTSGGMASEALVLVWVISRGGRVVECGYVDSAAST